MGVAEHPNVEFARGVYTAMASGNMEWMADHMHGDAVFHQTGKFPTAGTYHGRDAIFAHIGEFMQLVAGNFAIEAHDILGTENHAVALIKVAIQYKGKSFAFDEAHVFHIESGKLRELWAVPQDPYQVDAFFAAADS
jgi:ketosteroid isomerase-like protein